MRKTVAVQLGAPGDGRKRLAEAGLTVSALGPEVRVSAVTTSLFCPWRGLVHERPLPPRPSHRLRMRVTRQWLTVTVDGQTREYWTTAVTVDSALKDLGIRADGAVLSA